MFQVFTLIFFLQNGSALERLTQIDAKYSKMNLFFIILLLCEQISGNAISLQKEQILSREERFLDAILGATNNAG